MLMNEFMCKCQIYHAFEKSECFVTCMRDNTNVSKLREKIIFNAEII